MSKHLSSSAMTLMSHTVATPRSRLHMPYQKRTNMTGRRLFAVTAATASLVVVGMAGVASAGTRFAPQTTDTGQAWDLVTEFMINNGNAMSWGGDPNQIQNDMLEPAPINKFYYLKRRDDPTFWERYGISSSRIALERDTTAPSGNGGNAYDATPWGSMWMPRSWTVGTETSFDTTIRYFDKSSCTYRGGAVRWKYGRHFLRWQGALNMGGSLGIVDVAVIDRYHWISDDPGHEAYWNPLEAERFWYVRGRGWARWDHFRDRSTAAWNKSDPVGMANAGADKTVRMVNDFPAGNPLTPNKICNFLTP
jgi:hypothetical protein